MDLRSQNRRSGGLDARRLGALSVDSALFAPLSIVAAQYDLGATLLVGALALTYFFLCDATTGQTVGKAALGVRTVTLDGEVPGAGAAALRTVLRLVDHTAIGPIVLVLSGRRRQRVGDLVARTAVVRAGDAGAARPFRPVLLGWPAVWLAPALVLFVLSADGRLGGTYRAQADALCAEATLVLDHARTPSDVATVLGQLDVALADLPVPPNWRARHDVLVAEHRALRAGMDDLARRAAKAKRPDRLLERRWPALAAQADAANARLAGLGFRDCAGAPA